jgi:hypothetical protein
MALSRLLTDETCPGISQQGVRHLNLYCALYWNSSTTRPNIEKVAGSIAKVEARRLLRGLVVRLADADIDSEHGSVNINSIIRECRLG